MESVRLEDPIEGRDEQLADVQDAGHEAVGFSGVEHEQDDARCYDELDQPEQKNDDPPDHLGGPGARPVDAIDSHSFLLAPSGIRGSGVTKTTAGRSPPN